MTLEQRQRLLELGFVQGFNKGGKCLPTNARQKQFDDAFRKRIAELKAYKEEHGMCSFSFCFG